MESKLNSYITILDARKESEFLSERLDNDKVTNFPLDFVNENMTDLDKSKTYHIHCAGGYRSMIMSSILKSRGYENIIDIAGGFNAIKEQGLITTEYVCPSTLL